MMAATTPPPPSSSSAVTFNPAPPSTRCHGRALRASALSSHKAPPNEASSRRAGAMSSRDNETAAAITHAATAFDGTVLGIGLALCAASTWAKYFAASYALCHIRLAPSAPISDLRSFLPSSYSDDGGDAAAALVVVRGHVQPRSAVDSLPRASAASTWVTNEPSS